MIMKHDATPEVCKICNKEYVNLKQHVDNIHRAEMKSCNICQKEFSNSVNLNGHVRKDLIYSLPDHFNTPAEQRQSAVEQCQ